MTQDMKKARAALVRMAWLTAELYHGNQFGQDHLWKLHEEAAEAIRALDRNH
jgi:hypothetical protein